MLVLKRADHRGSGRLRLRTGLGLPIPLALDLFLLPCAGRDPLLDIERQPVQRVAYRTLDLRRKMNRSDRWNKSCSSEIATQRWCKW